MKLFIKIRELLRLFINRFKKAKITVYEAAISGDGSFVDIRYMITRPDLINPKASIYLVHDDSSIKLSLMHVPKFGAIKTKHNKFINNGILIFYNRNGLITRGSFITLFYDKLTASNVEVK